MEPGDLFARGQGTLALSAGAPRPVGLTILAAVFFLTALGTVLFWIDWFFGGHVATAEEACYRAFENAFPLADGGMSLLLVIGAIGLLRLAPGGFLWSLLGAGGLLALASLDATYNIEHGKYARLGDPAMAFEAYINAHCYVLGLATLTLAWKHRGRLIERDHARGWKAGSEQTCPSPLAVAAAVFFLNLIRVALDWRSGLSPGTSCEAVFENSFPLAEGLTALVGASAGIGILRRRAPGLAWSLIASGGLAFLASMWALFYLENAKWTAPDGASLALRVVVLYVAAAYTARAAWAHRGWLLRGNGRARAVS